MRRVVTRVRDAMLPMVGRVRRGDWPPTDDTVLIFQPDHLGDILLSQPAVTWLRGQYPTSRLIAIVGQWSQEIASMSWPVDEILTLTFPGFTRSDSRSPIDPYLQLRTEAKRLSRLRARSAYVLRPDAWWAAWLASLVSPEVVTANDPRVASFATLTAAVDDEDHSSVRSFRIAAAVKEAPLPTWSSSPLTLPQSASAAREANELLRANASSEPYVVVHPGSGAAVKEWPMHRWRAVVDALSGDGQTVVLTGSESESELCDAIALVSSSCQSMAGKTSVPVLAELLREASVVLGPDCGPLHLAVACGTPTVHLFGPSDPQRYGPWGDPARHRVISAGWSCPGCGDLSAGRPAGCGCMLAIDPYEVIDATRSLLALHGS